MQLKTQRDVMNSLLNDTHEKYQEQICALCPHIMFDHVLVSSRILDIDAKLEPKCLKCKCGGELYA